MSDIERKVLENRLRHAARRQGFWLVKSRRRDPRAVDYGRYALLDPRTRFPVTTVADPLGTGYPLDLHDVEEYLFGGDFTILVDDRPDHDALMFTGAPNEAIIKYRESCTTGAKACNANGRSNGRPLPDGWVVHKLDGDEHILGIWDRDAVDKAVAAAQAHLRFERERADAESDS